MKVATQPSRLSRVQCAESAGHSTYNVFAQSITYPLALLSSLMVTTLIQMVLENEIPFFTSIREIPTNARVYGLRYTLEINLKPG